MQKYRDLPRDFADACLVIMTEQDRYSACEVLTIDSDFLAYRRHGRLRISVQMPS
jgi:predicted nucleic acid-binding protein